MRAIFSGLILVSLAAFPSMGQAQGFSFGFATGGHHHGHGGYGGWYGFNYYRPLYPYPPPPVYLPPPVTYVYPAPVQVVQPVVPQAPVPIQSLSPQLSSNSSVRTNSLPAGQRSDVVLRNPAENGGPVAFRVQDQVDAELNAGTTRTWSDRSSLTVEFDRGGSFGATRKTLRPGAYEFVVTDEGWDLVAAASPAASTRSASLQKNAVPPRR